MAQLSKRGSGSGVPQLWGGEMGIELRKGRYYLYDRRRENGRIRRAYFGAVPPQGVALFRMQAEVDLQKREEARFKAEQLAKWADAVLAAGDGFEHLADGEFRKIMQQAGYKLHKRSEWRRTRGASAMDKMEAITQIVVDPKSAGVAEVAAAALMLQASGIDKSLSDGMSTKYWECITKLLADGPEPTFAERMAATRAAHNWLTVHILECKAALQPPAGPNATMIDKRVTLAERRLHASLKSLAVLRRLRKPVVLKQVNSAQGGMVVVNNRREE